MPNTTDTRPNTGTLSAQERAEMKGAFQAYMAAHPVPEAATASRRAVRSPYFPRIAHFPAFAVVALVFILSGTAYAAETSLPDDFLYPVKTGLIEPLFIEAPAFTAYADARASSMLLDRRLEEARDLVDEGSLSPGIVDYLSAELDEHTAAVDAYVASASAAGDFAHAFEISTEVETTLEAHQEVLVSVAETQGSSATESVRELVDDIESEATEASGSGDRLESVVAGASAADTESLINASIEEVTETLDGVRDTIPATDAALTDSLVRDAGMLVEEAETSRAASLNAYVAGNTQEAVEQARDSLRAAKQAAIYIESYAETE